MRSEQKVFDDVVSRLEVTRRNGNDVMALCPAHNDNSASLHVAMGRKLVLMYCFAGCPIESIVGSIGMSIHELYYDDDAPYQPGVRRTSRSVRTAEKEVRNWRSMTEEENEYQHVVTREAARDVLLRPIFPEMAKEGFEPPIPEFEGELHDRVRLLTSAYYDIMHNDRSLRIVLTYTRLKTLHEIINWNHERLMGREAEANKFLDRVSRNDIRQLALAGIVQNEWSPKPIENETMEEFLRNCEEGAWWFANREWA